MKTLLFIAHNFHRKTRSNRFLVEILKEHFEVTEVYLGPDRYSLDAPLFDVRPDFVVLWQLDYLAPIFLNKGIRTLVAPMYDGSANLGDKHWKLSSGASFLSFSYHLHSEITKAGCRSLLVKYFPEPSSEVVKDFSELKAFWWMRRLSGVVNIENILSKWGEKFKSLHVHLVPDNPNANCESLREEVLSKVALWREKNGKSEKDFTLTLSTWFESERDMLAVLGRSNVYIAPRRSEGIGMGFLKAMSRGMIVLAHNKPTHSEYIAHGVNGYLFSDEGLEDYDLHTSPEVIGRLARKTSEEGYKNWKNMVPEVIRYINSIEPPKHCKGYLSKEVYNRLQEAYFKGGNTYTRAIVREVPEVLVSSKVSYESRSNPKAPAVTLIPSLVPDESYGFGHREARQFFYEGWVNGGEKGNWIKGKEASLCFSFPDEAFKKTYTLQFVGRTTSKNYKLDKKPLKIFLNQKEIFSEVLSVAYESYEAQIPAKILKVKEPNILRFYCDSTMRHQDLEGGVSSLLESFVMVSTGVADPEIHLEEAHIKRKLLSKGSSLVNKIFR